MKVGYYKHEFALKRRFRAFSSHSCYYNYNQYSKGLDYLTILSYRVSIALALYSNTDYGVQVLTLSRLALA